jgi:hypothetical protein
MDEPAGSPQPDHLPIKQIWGTDWELDIIVEPVETDGPPPVAQEITPVAEDERIWREMVDVVRGGP